MAADLAHGNLPAGNQLYPDGYAWKIMYIFIYVYIYPHTPRHTHTQSQTVTRTRERLHTDQVRKLKPTTWGWDNPEKSAFYALRDAERESEGESEGGREEGRWQTLTRQGSESFSG